MNNHVLLVFVVSVLVTLGSITDAIDVTMGQSDDTQILSCTSDYVIVPTSVSYGEPGKSCQLKRAFKTVLDNCYNSLQCEMDFTYFDKPCKKAKMSKVVLSISYMCEEAANIIDVCDLPAQIPESFFLVSPNFPKNYPANQDCEFDVPPLESGQLHQLTILFMSVNKRGGMGCYDSLYIEDPDFIVTKNQYCGSTVDSKIGINHDWPLELGLDRILFTFYTDPRTEETGFLIRVGDLEDGPCTADSCDHGTCSEEGDTDFTCVCDDGYTGERCDVLIEPCESVECEHGTCDSTSGIAVCVCEEGWSGTTCEDEIDPCEGVECNNGDCVANSDGSTQCDCESGWEGDTCDEKTDPCEGANCGNGDCVDNGDGTTTCDCEDGWQGETCDEEIPDACEGEDCGNGDCVENDDGSTTCECFTGWEGDKCAKKKKVPTATLR